MRKNIALWWAKLKREKSVKIPWRRNVLTLVISGYLVLFLVFVAMMWPGEMKPDVAYEVVKGPLMALIGGSLAIAKDLINVDDDLAQHEISKNGSGKKDGDNNNSPDGADEKE